MNYILIVMLFSTTAGSSGREYIESDIHSIPGFKTESGCMLAGNAIREELILIRRESSLPKATTICVLEQ